MMQSTAESARGNPAGPWGWQEKEKEGEEEMNFVCIIGNVFMYFKFRLSTEIQHITMPYHTGGQLKLFKH